ncbi:methylated-DNA--[protein]-cysteine S-methyltransferase [Breznakiellaceae bacterium SP9]
MEKRGIIYCLLPTPLGEMLAQAKERAAGSFALTGLWFTGQKYIPSIRDTWTEKPCEPLFNALQSWLNDYFAGCSPPCTLALAPEGTAFQQSVWSILAKIPYGTTMSYGAIAALIKEEQGSNCSARSVGGAVGHNPLSLIIPCHRVIGADGSLSGYAGGIERKAYLLELEQKVRAVNR